MSKVKVSFWIDRPFALLRAKKYRHYRYQWLGKGQRPSDWLQSRPQRVATLARWEKRPKFVKRLLRLWHHLRNDAIAVWRRDTMAFEIGRPFTMGDRTWICTDVGTRTICAVLLDDLANSGDTGPPYSVVEHVLDRYDMDGCEPASFVEF
ncbi:MAG TPA: hypothetical protein VK550_17335 [Polyangiaceae bacterium]|nr:hypothetical protein [Polyangiaceae bacterium]